MCVGTSRVPTHALSADALRSRSREWAHLKPATCLTLLLCDGVAREVLRWSHGAGAIGAHVHGEADNRHAPADRSTLAAVSPRTQMTHGICVRRGPIISSWADASRGGSGQSISRVPCLNLLLVPQLAAITKARKRRPRTLGGTLWFTLCRATSVSRGRRWRPTTLGGGRNAGAPTSAVSAVSAYLCCV